MSVVMIGITGKPFTSAGSDVVNLFTSSFGDMALSTTVWVRMLFLEIDGCYV